MEQVRCVSRMVLLFIPRAAFQSALAALKKQQAGGRRLDEGMKNVLCLQSEACRLINDVMDLRLRIRARRLLAEYRFDYNISGRRYRAGQLLPPPEAALRLDVSSFPRRPRAVAVPPLVRFEWNGEPVLGPLRFFPLLLSL